MVKVLAWVVLLPFIVAFIIACLAWETWCAMTLWNWFAPWPLPMNLPAAMGMNVAVSLIVRGATKAKDERSHSEQFRDLCLFYGFAPAVALLIGVVLRWWS